MTLAPPGDQIGNLCKWRHLVAKFGTNASGATWLQNLQLMRLAPTRGKFAINEKGTDLTYVLIPEAQFPALDQSEFDLKNIDFALEKVLLRKLYFQSTIALFICSYIRSW